MLHSRHACLARDFLPSILAGDGEGVSFGELMAILKAAIKRHVGSGTMLCCERFVFVLVLGVAEPGYGWRI